jgi:hypothetical protein
MTALTTSWTEQSVVAFTVGTLASITQMTTEVESKLRRGTLGASSTPTSTQVQNWLIRGKEELAEIKNFTWTRKYAYADTVASTFRYALPADYHGGDVYLRDITNDKMIPIWPEIAFNNSFPDPAGNTNAEPDVCSIRGRELWLNCPANAVYRYELEYNRTGDDATATDVTWIPEIDRWRICDFAVYQSFLSLHQWEAANLYKQEWMMDLTKARSADGKQKWKGMDYHCPLWFK